LVPAHAASLDLSLERAVTWPDYSELSGLSKVAECCPPLLFEIVGFLAESPKDFASLCGMSARHVAVQMRPVANSMWKGMYAQKWPAFYDCLGFQGQQDWCRLYRETLRGQLECTLEVLGKESKLGFAMAAVPARVQYEIRLDAYVARYVDARHAPPHEKICAHEEHRLRFCPESVRGKLLNSCPQQAPENSSDAKVDSSPHAKAPRGRDMLYPHRVLQGVEGLEVGDGVELQWKMHEGSPFSWWYGQLDALSRTSDGLAQATITLPHLPATSKWYRLDVLFGDSKMRDCAFGGFTGGIRPLSDAEKRQCMALAIAQP